MGRVKWRDGEREGMSVKSESRRGEIGDRGTAKKPALFEASPTL